MVTRRQLAHLLMAQIVGHFPAGQIVAQLDFIQAQTVHQTENASMLSAGAILRLTTKTLHCDGHRTLLTEEVRFVQLANSQNVLFQNKQE